MKVGRCHMLVLACLYAAACAAGTSSDTTGQNSSAPEGVVLLHGLCRTSASMEKMERALSAAGFRVFNADYPSRSEGVETLSREIVGGAMTSPALAGCPKIHFVTHSLGGILVRCYFADRTDPRLGRVVMLGPPNQGSEVVDNIGDWRLFREINGPAGSELGTGTNSLPTALGPVSFELGVIAGNRSINWINSAMIPGPDDGKVSVPATKVAGMKDHIVIHTAHPFIMDNPDVISAATRFIVTGSFLAGPGKNVK